MKQLERISERLEKLSDEQVRDELTNILFRYSEIGNAGYQSDDLIAEIKSLYLKISKDI